ncbi:MAG: ATP-binding cassette domain-containing protein, partial [Halieaceae bacterium]|nr:ATP-binding cassette domain-containing protein [Halieaceae bacterium]
LHDLDWQFHAGEQWACLGPNGAGKTTLASILGGQLRCSSGNVAPFGHTAPTGRTASVGAILRLIPS